jgi:hypothetical protein
MPPHVGQLTESQLQAFEDFKKLASEKKLFKPEETVDGSWVGPTHDDSTLLYV